MDTKAVTRAAKHQEDVEAAQVRERARLAALRLEQEAAAAAAGGSGTGTTTTTAPAPGAAAAGGAGGGSSSSSSGGGGGGGGAGASGVPELERDELGAHFIAAEVAEVRAKLPREGQRERLRSATPDSVQVVISASRVRCVLLKAFFPAGYPATPLALELEALAAPPPGSSSGSSGSVRLSPVLVAKLQAALEAEARKHAGGRQVLHAVHWLSDCLHANRLAAAYDEIQVLRSAAAAAAADPAASTSSSTTGSNSSNSSSTTSSSNNSNSSSSPSSASGLGCSLELKAVKEKSGVVEVVLRAGAYFLDLRCVLPEAYPDAGVELHTAATNLPADLLTSSLAGAADLVRRLAEPPPALVRVEVARAGAGTGGGSGSSSAASSASATPQRRRGGGGGQQTLHSEAKAAALAAAAQEGAAAREAARAAAAAAHEPRPSLWPAVCYMGSRCVGLLCEGRCVACGKWLLPRDPAQLEQVPAGMRLLRLVTCGHFFHHKCIEGLLAEPPFGRDGCPVSGCGERISHHRLVTEPQVLEARWAGRQARRREIEDAASILGL
ncbi:hypothetical protein HXX76_000365 [Chlamydomonas incerta]|uniref:RWD domain-containing protein n=1 Tax=Chlamydomonas incerta TaxID=51695 RepID=A0A836B2G8_CHLIN|nr:hypothetical protein HXX76_000365 [Chlamydomonas incerta]|eukprot:KAG2445760.1 hypothetical protein HXX76_000365 [Chlamydomonas incerta]